MLRENSNNHNGGCEANGAERSKEESIRRMRECGPLGLTATDHKNIGSTPDKILIENPGKTLGELISDEEILGMLDRAVEDGETFQEILKMDPQNAIAIDGAGDFPKNVLRDIATLRSIGRLPEKYRGFDVEKIRQE